MSHKVKIKNGKLVKNDKINKREKAKLLIIGLSIKGFNDKQLWELYGTLTNLKNDRCKHLIFKMLDTEMDKRKIIHDFSKDYKKEVNNE